jgi:hypothetical protein
MYFSSHRGIRPRLDRDPGWRSVLGVQPLPHRASIRAESIALS